MDRGRFLIWIRESFHRFVSTLSTGATVTFTVNYYSQIAEPLLPYSLAFAAGAMVFVVVDDIVPEACSW